MTPFPWSPAFSILILNLVIASASSLITIYNYWFAGQSCPLEWVYLFLVLVFNGWLHVLSSHLHCLVKARAQRIRAKGNHGALFSQTDLNWVGPGNALWCRWAIVSVLVYGQWLITTVPAPAPCRKNRWHQRHHACASRRCCGRGWEDGRRQLLTRLTQEKISDNQLKQCLCHSGGIDFGGDGWRGRRWVVELAQKAGNGLAVPRDLPKGRRGGAGMGTGPGVPDSWIWSLRDQAPKKLPPSLSCVSAI